MDDVIYSPILPAKAGELTALGALTSFAQVRTRPMLDIPKPRGGSLDKHLSSVAELIAQTWGIRLPIFVDFSRFEPDMRIGEVSFVEYFFEVARKNKIKAIPVAGPLDLRGPGTAYLDAVATVARFTGGGLGLRIPFECAIHADELKRIINDCLTCLSIDEVCVDLFLDGGALDTLPALYQRSESLVTVYSDALRNLRARNFRSITLGGSSIPQIVPRSKEWRPTKVLRREYSAWEALVTSRPLSRIRFMDYGITYPNFVDPTGSVIPPSRIRLTTADAHYLFRTERDNHRTLCEKVAVDEIFGSQVRSWGKDAVRNCAIGTGGIGIPMDWVARDTNMHMENAVRQIDEVLHDLKGYEYFHFAAEESKAVLQDSLI